MSASTAGAYIKSLSGGVSKAVAAAAAAAATTTTSPAATKGKGKGTTKAKKAPTPTPSPPLPTEAPPTKKRKGGKAAAAQPDTAGDGAQAQMAGLDPEEAGGGLLLPGVAPNGKGWYGAQPTVGKHGVLKFADYPEFSPNQSPKQVLHARCTRFCC
jgi:hypothetical protein